MTTLLAQLPVLFYHRTEFLKNFQIVVEKQIIIEVSIQ